MLRGNKTKNKILPLAIIWIDLVDILLSEVSQTENDKFDKYHYDVESKTKQNQNIFKETETKRMVTRGERNGGMI